MAEVLLSPGISLNENDTSQITSGVITAGLALVGPTVKGRPNIPTLVTSYSDFKSKFGDSFESASANYEFLTSMAAYNYFQQGGQTALVTRVTSGSYTSAEAGVPNAYGINNSGSYATCSFNLQTTTTDPNFEISVVNGTDYWRFIAVNTAASGSIPDDDVDGKVYFYAWNNNLDVKASLTQDLAIKLQSVFGPSNLNLFNCVYNGATNGIDITAVFTGNEYNDYYFTAGKPIPYYDSNYAIIGYVINPTELLAVTGGGLDGLGVAFILETISEGAIMNNSGSMLSNGALSLGNQDNIRWQVVASDSASGLFSLVIRQGNDTQQNPVVLESWTNLSLDPNQTNYIERVIGNYKQTPVYDSSTGQYYLQETGQYANSSRYVRVKQVNTPTYNYFQNNGVANPVYFQYMPLVGMGTNGGSFSGATGNDLATVTNLYNNINIVTQGLKEINYVIADDLLSNTDQYDFQLISTPGLTQNFHSAAISSFITIAENRGDCFYILDAVGYGAQLLSACNSANALNTNYAATYWPWVQMLSPATGKLVWVPASTVMPGVYAFNDRVAAEWFAPAGLNRGGVGGALQAERKLGTNDRDTLYQNKVNPIATFPGVGLVAYGQKTLQTKASALDRVNVRRLLINLKRFVRTVSETLLFENNTLTTRNNFLASVNPYLESVQQKQGLYAYKVVMDDSNNTPDTIDRNQLVGAIYIQPAKTIEFIYIDFNITPTGVTFGS